MYTLYTCCPQRNRLVWPVKMCVSDHVTLLLGNPPKTHKIFRVRPKVLKYHHFLDLFSYRFHPSHSAPTTPASPAPISSTSCWLYPWALQFPDPTLKSWLIPSPTLGLYYNITAQQGMHWPSCWKLHLLVFFLLHFHLPHIPSYIFYLDISYVMSSSQ